MTGKSHAAIGLATGAMVGMIGVSMGVELAPLALVASAFGAKFPDIDHHATELGRKRVAVEKAIKAICIAAIILMVSGIVILTGIEVWKTQDTTKLIKPAILLAIIAAVIGVAIWISKLQCLKFYHKHRGIMHTLFVPTVLIIACIIKLDSEVLQWILLGFTFGYISHLVADCLTDRGCPLFWPFSTEPVHIPGLAVATGSVGEYIWAFILIGGQLCLGYLFLKPF